MKKQDRMILNPRSESLQKLREGSFQLRIKRYYAMNFDFFEMEPHAHTELEIMYIVHGFCKIKVWKANEKQELILKEGEYIFLDSGVKHQLEIEKNNRCRLLNLEMAVQKAEDMTWQLLSVSDSFISLVDALHGFLTGFDAVRNLHMVITRLHGQMQTELDLKEHYIMQQLLLTQMLIELGRQLVRVNRNEHRSKYVNRAMEYMKAHFDEEISVGQIAEQVGTSSAYLQRLIKEETGKTLILCVNEMRIEKAKLLLETSSLPVVDIAVSIGYNNRQHFTHTFQKMTGCSPGLYRKQKGNTHLWQGF